eukprot:GILK01010748.1.p1 GENE.GILK01010748.1~~GILK01010748.1.p1  ORF type:complete len:386 (+),score=26.05 GILK01010748.1:86-1243(+)
MELVVRFVVPYSSWRDRPRMLLVSKGVAKQTQLSSIEGPPLQLRVPLSYLCHHFPQLTSLQLNMTLIDEHLEALSHVRHLREIKCQNFNSHSFRRLVDSLVDHQELRCVTVISSSVTMDDFTYGAGMFRQLEALEIEESTDNIDMLKNLSAPRLRKLVLSDVDSVTNDWSTLERLKNLVRLEVYCANVSCESRCYLSTMTQLQFLALQRESCLLLNRNHFDVLRTFSHLTSLHYDLGFFCQTDHVSFPQGNTDFSTFCSALEGLPLLESVEIRGWSECCGKAVLRSISNLQQVRKLVLDMNIEIDIELPDVQELEFDPCIALRKLQRLSLSGWTLPVDLTRLFCRLLQIQSLSLSNCYFYYGGKEERDRAINQLRNEFPSLKLHF